MISDGESAKELGLDTDTTDTDEVLHYSEMLIVSYRQEILMNCYILTIQSISIMQEQLKIIHHLH